MQSAAGKEVTSSLALLVQKYKYLFTSTKLQILTPEQLQLPSGPANLRNPFKRFFPLTTTYYCIYYCIYFAAQRPSKASKASKPEQSFEGECLDLKDFVAQALEPTKFTLTNGILSFKFRADSREQMEQVRPAPSVRGCPL